MKLSLDWKPKQTRAVIAKMYDVTNFHSMDDRSAVLGAENYQLTASERRNYHIVDSICHCNQRSIYHILLCCNSVEEKKGLLEKIFIEKKRQIKTRYFESRDACA